MFGNVFKNIFRKPDPENLQYDPSLQKPILHCSICTDEQVAGLKDINTGRFQEIMVVRNQSDLEKFRKSVGTKEIDKEY